MKYKLKFGRLHGPLLCVSCVQCGPDSTTLSPALRAGAVVPIQMAVAPRCTCPTSPGLNAGTDDGTWSLAGSIGWPSGLVLLAHK